MQRSSTVPAASTPQQSVPAPLYFLSANGETARLEGRTSFILSGKFLQQAHLLTGQNTRISVLTNSLATLADRKYRRTLLPSPA
jgi:hypothetical protein